MDDFDLLEAAFWIAVPEYPDLDVPREVARVHFLAAEGARRVDDLANPFARIDGLRAFVYEELGFSGSVHNYHDPRNSYMNEVLNRKIGIPLTLSLLFMEIARASGYEVAGVGLPGHFVLRLTYGGRELMVDPFHGGRVITEEDCHSLVMRTTGRPIFRSEHLQAVGQRTMLRRMLLNLKHVYVKLGDYSRALSMVEKLLAITPGDVSEVRDRGFLQAHLGRPSAAIMDLETYLTASPHAPDGPSVRGRVVLLRRRLSDLN
jgi:regulator of sirC expression with transglutaminase-like and TPR domain